MNRLSWWIYLWHLDGTAATLRYWLYRRLYRWVREVPYADPEAVGWRSALRVPGIGVIAFRRLDGCLQHWW